MNVCTTHAIAPFAALDVKDRSGLEAVFAYCISKRLHRVSTSPDLERLDTRRCYEQMPDRLALDEFHLHVPEYMVLSSGNRGAYLLRPSSAFQATGALGLIRSIEPPAPRCGRLFGAGETLQQILDAASSGGATMIATNSPSQRLTSDDPAAIPGGG